MLWLMLCLMIYCLLMLLLMMLLWLLLLLMPQLMLLLFLLQLLLLQLLLVLLLSHGRRTARVQLNLVQRRRARILRFELSERAVQRRRTFGWPSTASAADATAHDLRPLSSRRRRRVRRCVGLG